MKPDRFGAFAAMLLLPCAALAATDDIKPCEAIPAAEVESALGIKVTRAIPTYRTCQWMTATPAVTAQAKAFKRAGQSVAGTGSLDAFKKMGYATTVLDDTADLWCAKIVGASGMIQMINCRALTKGHYFEVDTNGQGMTREKAKALVAKIAARLP